jgi:hypothetical protein
MYPLCTYELSTELLYVCKCNTGNFFIKLAKLSLTVSCQNGCVDVILKFILFIESPPYVKENGSACGMNSDKTEHGPVTGFCEDGNRLCFINDKEFLEQLKDYQLLEKDCLRLNCLIYITF